MKLTVVFDAQHGGFTTGWSPASWGSIDELFVNLTMPPPDSSVQRLTLTYDTPVVGAVVTASATGLPAGTDVELQWATVSGGWVIEDYYHFLGKQYTETTSSLGRFPVDQDGRVHPGQAK